MKKLIFAQVVFDSGI